MFYIGALIYLSSLLLTLINRKVNELHVIRDIANFDRKINYDRLKENTNIISLYNLRSINYQDFIPLYNVFISLLFLFNYLIRPEMYLEELDSLLILNEMDNIEKYEYKKNSSLLNLLKVLMRGYSRMKNASVLTTYDEEDEMGKVFYEINNDDILILKTEGMFNSMTISEMKNIIKDDNLGALLGDAEDIVVNDNEEISEITDEKNYLLKMKQRLLEMKPKNKVKQKKL